MDFDRPNAEIRRKMANGWLISSTDCYPKWLLWMHGALLLIAQAERSKLKITSYMHKYSIYQQYWLIAMDIG